MSAHFILKKSVLHEHYNRLTANGWQVTYSVKTNPLVGKILSDETDCQHSIQSLAELDYLNDASKVWYLAQAINKELVQKIISKNITRFVIENEEDLRILLESAGAQPVDIMLRMKVREHTIFTGKYYVFGMSSTTINTLVQQLHEDKRVNSIGLHFHRKTQNVSEWDLISELEDSITEENWQHITCVNIGGGFPAKYKNISDAAIDSVFRKVNAVKDWLIEKNCTLMVEPGRYLAAPCIELHTTITGIRGNTLVIDASVYQCAMDTLLVPIKLLVKGESEVGEKYLIKGKTPCSMDIFRYDLRLSNTPQVGDHIVFLNAGAYNFTTDFCELTKLATKIV